MRKEKKFDCVELKDQIQQQLQREQAGLSDQEIRERFLKKMETSDNPVARKWRSLRRDKGAKAA